MIFNYRKLLSDYGYPYNDEIAIHRGYIVVPCPFCRSSHEKYHGAIHIQYNHYKCWKCSGHSLYDFIKNITGQNWFLLQKQYAMTYIDKYPTAKTTETPKELVLPEYTGEMNDRARQYLIKRNYDPNKLIEQYSLQSTNHLGKYKFRIIIPVFFQGEMVSYTTRDYTNMAKLRYDSCPKDLELINHKDIVFGYDNVPTSHVIVVEGPFDVFRMGENAVATFGIGFTMAQVNTLASFEKVTIIYDKGKEEEKQANKLGGLLDGLGVEADIFALKDTKDPGSLPQNEADSLVREIIKEQ
jgi:transposase-like protein